MTPVTRIVAPLPKQRHANVCYLGLTPWPTKAEVYLAEVEENRNHWRGANDRVGYQLPDPRVDHRN